MFIFRGTTLRGPYETSLNEFVDCVCTVLEEGKSYTYNQARKKCGVSYQTVEDYVTIERSDVNLRIVEECGRSVKPEDIRRTYPGLRVYPLGDGLSHPDSCLTELGKETENKQYIPRDLLPKRPSFFSDTTIPRLSEVKQGKHIFHVMPLLGFDIYQQTESEYSNLTTGRSVDHHAS
jgi:hypothetical protein